MPTTEFAYKNDHPYEKRAAEAARIREKYPDRIPVICEREPRSNIPPVDKRKYLIPMDLTVGQFVYVIRKRISIPPEKAIFGPAGTSTSVSARRLAAMKSRLSIIAAVRWRWLTLDPVRWDQGEPVARW